MSSTPILTFEQDRVTPIKGSSHTDAIPLATGTYAAGTLVGQISASLGKYGAYASGHSDGTQVPEYILEYACYVDSSGNITFGTNLNSTTGGEWGQSYLTAPAYKGGEFSIADLPNLDANAATVMGARVLEGSIAGSSGRILIPV